MTDLREKLDSCVRTYGKVLGKEFYLKDGVCSVSDASGQEYVVDLPENSTDVYFCAPIATLNDKDSMPMDFEQALKWNLWGHETQGGTLSFEEMTQRIILHGTLPVENLDENSFAEAFNTFIGSVLHIRELWDSYKQNGSIRTTEDIEKKEPTDPAFWV